MKPHALRCPLITATLLIGIVALAACNFPGIQATPDTFGTAAAETIAARLTQVAVAVTDTPPSPPPTLVTDTPVPTVPPSLTPVPPTATTQCTDSVSSAVADVTYPDFTNVPPGGTFNKTWRLTNAGSCTWNTSYSLVFASGSAMGGPGSQPLPASVPPGATVDVTVTLTAPSAAGTYTGFWKLRNDKGVIFGIGTGASPFWVKITVGPSPTPAPAVYKAAHIEVPQTWLADLETGAVTGSSSTADFWFEAVSAAEKYLTPKNGAKFLIVGSTPSYSTCSGAAVSTAKIPLASIPDGTWMCYKTNDGRFGRMQFDTITPGPGAQTMRIDFRTWSTP
jgi:hypothetical protein